MAETRDAYDGYLSGLTAMVESQTWGVKREWQRAVGCQSSGSKPSLFQVDKRASDADYMCTPRLSAPLLVCSARLLSVTCGRRLASPSPRLALTRRLVLLPILQRAPPAFPIAPPFAESIRLPESRPVVPWFLRWPGNATKLQRIRDMVFGPSGLRSTASHGHE